MKKFIVLLVALFLFGCDEDVSKSDAQKFFEGTHELMSLNNIVGIKSFDDIYAVIENNTVLFYWKDNRGTYTMAQVPINQIRFDIVGNRTCKFRWKSGTFCDGEAKWLDNVVYVVLSVNEKQIIRK